MAGLVVLILLYAIVLFSEFFAPYALFERAKGLEQHPPMRVRFIDLDGTFHLRPFVYGMQGTLDLSTFVKTWTPVKEQRYPISLFVRGPEYKLLGLLPIKSGVRLFGVQGRATSSCSAAISGAATCSHACCTAAGSP